MWGLLKVGCRATLLSFFNCHPGVHLQLFSLKLCVLDLSLCISLTFPNTTFQSMSLFSLLNPTVNATLSKTYSSLFTYSPYRYVQLTKSVFYFLGTCMNYIRPSLNSPGPLLSWQVDEDYDNDTNGSLDQRACIANVEEGSVHCLMPQSIISLAQ